MDIKKKFKILFVEDQPLDVEMATRSLKKSGVNYISRRVDTEPEFIHALKDFNPDIIISDYSMPEFDGMRSLEIVVTTRPEIPVIIFTGSINEETAVECMKAGATDYILKDHITRLPYAVLEALKKSAIEKEKNIAILELEESEERYKALYKDNQSIMLIINPENGKIIDANSSACEFYGWEYDHLISMNMRDINKVSDNQLIENMKDAVKNKTNLFYFDHAIADGRIKNVEVYTGPIKIKGETVLYSIVHDITERKKAQEELKILAHAIRSINDCVSVSDLNNNFIFVNHAFLRIYGYTQSEIYGKNAKILGSDRNPKGISDLILKETIRGGWAGEVWNKRKDGSEFLIYLSTSTIKDESGSIIALVGISNEITEQKQKEILLQQTKQTYIDIFNSITEAFYILNENYKFIDVNKGAEIMYGYSRNELIGKTPASVAAPGLNELKNIIKLLDSVSKTGKPERFEFWAKRKNGEIFPKDVIVNKAKYFGEDRLIAVARDITERKKAEQLQNIIYNISQAANTDIQLDKLIEIIQQQLKSIIDIKNFYVAFYNPDNDTFSTPYMLDEKDKFETWPAGKSLTAYVFKSGEPKLLNKKDLIDLNKKGVVNVVGTMPEVWLGLPLKIKGKTYAVFAVQNYKNPETYSDKDLEILEFVSHQMSISIERKKADDELKAAYIKVMESDRLKSAFLATMSHELRTPLNAIIGFSELIKEKLSMEKILTFSGIVNKSGRHLLEIVEDLFDVTLLEIGQVNIFKENHRLHEIMESVGSLIEAEKNKIESKLKIIYKPEVSDEDLKIYTDKSKLKQILINLLKNALKFTQEGYVEYGYERIIEKETPLIRFYVKDTGIGILKEKQEFIFDIFRQVDESLTRFYGGTGIGLFVVKRFTEILGGKVIVESELGVGSTFFVTIPYMETVEMKFPKSISKDKKHIPINLSNKTILIVEDDLVSSELLVELLNEYNAKFIVVQNGKDAVKKCKENIKIDLILMDIKMPDMDGYEATKLIKKEYPDLTIVAQTAHAIVGDKEKVLESGFDYYISKPIKVEELNEIIQKVLIK